MKHDAMTAVWKNMLEKDRGVTGKLFEEFEKESAGDPSRGVWIIDHVRRLMETGLCSYDDVSKLRGCFLAGVEDTSIYHDPLELEEAADAKRKRDHAQRQLALDNDYASFSFMPREMLKEYLVKMKVNAKSEKGREVSAKLFCHSTTAGTLEGTLHHLIICRLK